MPTVKDVARRAGTSVGTVSFVLNDTRPVSPELRERVLQAIEELQYQPNLVARSLRSKRSRIIGLLVSDIRNPFYAELVSSIQKHAQDSDYHLIVCNTFEDPDVECEQLEALRNYHVDGLIIAPTLGDHDHLDCLNETKTPTVLVNRRLEETDWPAIIADNHGAARQATEHLLQNGRTRIGIVLTVPNVSHNTDRVAGYREILFEHGIEYDPELVLYTGLTAQDSQVAVRDFLNQRRDVNALFCGSTSATLGSLLAAKNLGICVPDQIALIGSGNMGWGPLLTPPLTHFTQPTYDMGICAVDRLMTLIEASVKGHAAPPESNELCQLPLEMEHGGSCGCPPDTTHTPQFSSEEENLEGSKARDRRIPGR